jgi:tubulin alpha
MMPEDPLSARVVGLDTEFSRSFFDEDRLGRWTPRALMLDSDSDDVDWARSTDIGRSMFASDSFLTTNEGAAVTYARGKMHAKWSPQGKLVDAAVERIRRMADASDSMQGFILTHAVGGGSAGIAAELMEQLSVEYGKKTKIAFSVFPSPSVASSVVEPYNSVLSLHSLLGHTDFAIALENEAIFDLCRNRLDIERPSYDNLNRLTAQALSAVTYAMRHDGALNTSLIELSKNFVPYPRIHFNMLSFGPLISSDRTVRDAIVERYLHSSNVYQQRVHQVQQLGSVCQVQSVAMEDAGGAAIDSLRLCVVALVRQAHGLSDDF